MDQHGEFPEEAHYYSDAARPLSDLEVWATLRAGEPMPPGVRPQQEFRFLSEFHALFYEAKQAFAVDEIGFHNAYKRYSPVMRDILIAMAGGNRVDLIIWDSLKPEEKNDGEETTTAHDCDTDPCCSGG